MFAKIENGVLKYPPKHLNENGRYVANYNHHTQDLIADGWMEVITSEPEQREGFNPIPRYEEIDGCIYQTWDYVEAVNNQENI